MIPSTFGIKKETIIYGAIAIVVLIILIQILRKTGLFTSKEKKALRAERAATKLEKVKTKTLVRNASIYLQNVDAFKMDYHKKFHDSLLDQQNVQNVAKTIRGSMRGPGTRESTLIGTLRSLKNWAQVSQVAAVYYSLYQRSLINDILEESNEKERFDIYQVISNMPKS